MTSKFKLFGYSTLTAIALLLSGCCSDQYGFPPEGTTMVQTSLTPFTNKKVEVLPFNDLRPKDANNDMYILWLIPPFPYGYGIYEHPEKADFFTSISSYSFDPSKDLARAASGSFEQSNIFSQVLYSNNEGKYESDFILTGEIYSTQYTGRRFSYCSSFLTVIWWTLGAPLGTSYNELSLSLYLKDKQGNIRWHYTAQKSDYVVDWMYSPYDDCVKYPILTNQIMNEAVMDLYKRTLENPEVLK